MSIEKLWLNFLHLHKFMNFYYKLTNYIEEKNRLQIVIWYHINLFINLYKPILNLCNQIFSQVYIVKSSLMFNGLFMNTLLWLSLTDLIIEPKSRYKLDLFAKQMNVNKIFIAKLELFINSLVYLDFNLHED